MGKLQTFCEQSEIPSDGGRMQEAAGGKYCPRKLALRTNVYPIGDTTIPCHALRSTEIRFKSLFRR